MYHLMRWLIIFVNYLESWKNIPFVLASLLLRIQYKVLLVLVALLLKDFKWDNTCMEHLWMSYLKAMESENNYSW